MSDTFSSDPSLPELPPGLEDVEGLDRRRIADLIAEIKMSADKLATDRTSRGDLKLLSRALRELRYAFKVFTPYRNRRKVTVFGSARTRPHDPAFEQAVAFGRAMAEHEWLVVTGAASGIMEAGHIGAGRENSMGLNIMLPFEQYANPVIAGDTKLVHMKYFFTRKLMFVKECDAVCLLPGGFGTLDEGLEVLTLLQTGKRDMVPVVFLDAPGGAILGRFSKVRRAPAAGPQHDLARGFVALQADRQGRRGGRRDPAVLPRLSKHALREEQARVAAQGATQRRPAGRYQRALQRHRQRRAIFRWAVRCRKKKKRPTRPRTRG